MKSMFKMSPMQLQPFTALCSTIAIAAKYGSWNVMCRCEALDMLAEVKGNDALATG
jgi:hypothetical protein